MTAIGRLLAVAILAATVSKITSPAGALNPQFHGKIVPRDSELQAPRISTIFQKENVPRDIVEVRKFFNEIFSHEDGSRDKVMEEGRTFGHKRIQFMLMPLMYKMGVMMTLLTVLTVISLKGLVIGSILLILKLSTLLAKFHSLWHPPAQHGWSGNGQPVHVHLHNSFPHAHSQAYSGWDSVSGPSDEHYYYKG